MDGSGRSRLRTMFSYCNLADKRLKEQKKYSQPMSDGRRALAIRWHQSEKEKEDLKKKREEMRQEQREIIQKYTSQGSSAACESLATHKLWSTSSLLFSPVFLLSALTPLLSPPPLHPLSFFPVSLLSALYSLHFPSFSSTLSISSNSLPVSLLFSLFSPCDELIPFLFLSFYLHIHLLSSLFFLSILSFFPLYFLCILPSHIPT